MPPLGEELQKSHDDDGLRKVIVQSKYDSQDVLIHGREADRNAKTILTFNTTFPASIFGDIQELEAKQCVTSPIRQPIAPCGGVAAPRCHAQPAHR